MDQRVVGVDVELLLLFALDVAAADGADHVRAGRRGLTLAWVILVASVMAESSQEKAPVACGE